MITITVKTLDSQNHSFYVQDDMTVEEFKAHIAETVNIPASTQRIIYCGRVLQDSALLSEYDVNGKTVHLVQRPPPTSPPTFSESARATSPSPATTRRVFMEPGNTMYLGSMPFPQNLIDSQGIVQPPPTHTLAGSRLNVARRMLRRAELTIRLLENPSLRPNEQNLPDEQQEEVTPVIEARVIVPSTSNEPFNEEMVLSAVHDTLMHASGVTSSSANEGQLPPTVMFAQEDTVSASEAENTPLPNSSFEDEYIATSANNSEDQRQEPSSSSATNNTTFPENASRTSEMAELLTIFSNLQLRFAPFLERYQNFMEQDPAVPREDYLQTQTMLQRVSGVLHLFAHASHSLSDIILRVNQPPPRPLLCRPILIQHSTVVQAGIPIQLEAQINLTPDRNTTTEASQTATTTTTTTSANTYEINTNTTSTQPQPSAPSQPRVSLTSSSVSLGGSVPLSVQQLNLPLMRLQSVPLEIRQVAARASSLLPGSENRQSQQTPTSQGNTGAANPAEMSSGSGGVGSTDASDSSTRTGNGQRLEDMFTLNGNANFEFLMELTPEVLRHTVNGPTPEFLQSLMQVAGQMMSRMSSPSGTSSTTRTTETGHVTDTTTTSNGVSMGVATGTATTTAAFAGNGSGTGTNGSSSQQAPTRGSTQTNPTTSTNTRTTARPHVHLAQQAMQAGFDPFLPCNSHHLPSNMRRRQTQLHQTPNSGVNRAGGSEQWRTGFEDRNVVGAVVSGLISSLRDISTQQLQQRGTADGRAASEGATRGAGGSGERSTASDGEPAAGDVFGSSMGTFMSTMQNLSNLEGSAISNILQFFPPYETYNQGESLIADLIMMLSQNLTIRDVFTLGSGQLEPLNRMRGEIAYFVMNNVRQNRTDQESIDTAVERIIDELRPFLTNFAEFPVSEDIDMVRSAEALLRGRLPNIITVASNLNNTNGVRLLVDQCLTTARQLCALVLLASDNGQSEIENAFEILLSRYMQSVPRNLQHWTLMTSRLQLRQFIRGLNEPESILRPYIVRRELPVSDAAVLGTTLTEVTPAVPTVEPPVQPSVDLNKLRDTELMDLDDNDADASGSEVNSPPLPPLEDDDTLPNVVIGSENWHGQVPPDWVPIITRDSQRQRKQNSQPPFSDAYLSGMPSKRRKLIESSKPQGSLPQVISEGVRRAVNTTGFSSVVPLETVADAAGSSTEVQSAYRNMLRSSVQSTLRDNTDFTPERFPNIDAYFNPPHN